MSTVNLSAAENVTLPSTSSRGRHGTASSGRSLECNGSPYHLDPLCRTPTNKYSYTRGTLSTRGSCVSLVVSARQFSATFVNRCLPRVPILRSESHALVPCDPLEERRGWGTALRPAIKANLLNTQSLWVALIALVYSLFFRQSIVDRYYNISLPRFWFITSNSVEGVHIGEIEFQGGRL